VCSDCNGFWDYEPGKKGGRGIFPKIKRYIEMENLQIPNPPKGKVFRTHCLQKLEHWNITNNNNNYIYIYIYLITNNY